MALKDQYDIDITFVCKKEKNISREHAKTVLGKIERKFEKPAWLRRFRPMYWQNMPLPVLQFEVYSQQFEKQFRIKNIDKIDITAGNETAVINSEIISNFAKIPEIHLFCMLVKLWAKNRSVINKFNPMMGLSSYGIILMCLYFLMETNQIKFLDLSST